MSKNFVYISNYQGRLGNHMFQFAWAKAVSLKLNKELSVPGIACDPEKDEGSLFLKTHFLRHIKPSDKCINDFVEINDSNSELPFTRPDLFVNKSIKGTGFFQNYHLFKAYKNEIKPYFELKTCSNMKNTLGIHIRLDDFPQQFRCPLEYYIKCIEQTSCDHIRIFTDEPTHPFITTLKSRFNNLTVDNSYTCTGQNNFEVLSEMSSCDEIVISKSSYSWWAAYLSNAQKVYFPSTPNNTEYFADEFYFVDNEQRYIKITV